MLAIAGEKTEPNGLNYFREPWSIPGVTAKAKQSSNFFFQNSKFFLFLIRFKKTPTGNAGHFS